jgi:hypothetical protein
MYSYARLPSRTFESQTTIAIVRRCDACTLVIPVHRLMLFRPGRAEVVNPSIWFNSKKEAGHRDLTASCV